MLLIQLFASTGRSSLFSKADWNSKISCTSPECVQLVASIQNRFQNNNSSTFTDALNSCLARNLGSQKLQEVRSDLSRGSMLNLTLNDLQIIESCLINPQGTVHPTNSHSPTPTSAHVSNPTPTPAQGGAYACPAGTSRHLCNIAMGNNCLQENLCIVTGKNCPDDFFWIKGTRYNYSEGICPSFQCAQNMNRLYCHFIQGNLDVCANSTLCAPSGYTCSDTTKNTGWQKTTLQDNNCDGSTGLNWVKGR